MGRLIYVALWGFKLEPQLGARITGRRGVDDITQTTQGARGTRIGQSVEAHGEGTALRVGDQIGGGPEHRPQELAGFVLVPFEQGRDPASQLGLGSIGDHLEGVGEQLALALQLHDPRRVKDLVERHVLGQRVRPRAQLKQWR